MAGALIGALRVSLSAETTAFEAGMSRAQAVAKKTAANINKPFDNVSKTLERTALRFAEVLTLAAVYRAGKAALEYAGHLGELADTLGLTTKDLQTFSYAAGQVGISQEELESGIQKLTISMGKAEVGSQAQVKAFKAIGISIDEIKGKNAGDVFRLIADKLQNVTDRSQRAAVEVALFGKAGAKLDNLLSGSQGTLNELSDAAEKLGIVLSDEQIRNADKTADKIAALQTALKARIAGVVADNARSIYELIDALSALVAKLPVALRSYQAFIAGLAQARGYLAQISRNPADRSEGRLQVAVAQSQLRDLQNQQRGGESFDTRAARLRERLGLGSAPATGSGANVGDFLAPSRGGGSHSAKKDDLERKQLDALQKAYDFQKSDLDAQKDILGAKKDLSEDYIEQTTLQIQILNLERQQYQADLDNQVAQNKITKGKEGISRAQADQLLSQYDIADGLKRQKVLQDEEEQRQRDVGELDDHILDRQKDYLGKLADLATTQADRRKIQLEILDLEYQEKKQVLDRIIANSKNAKEVEDARRDLVDLNKNYSADRQGVMNSTRNPLEEWAASIPKTKDEIIEALQEIEAKGLDGLADALTNVLMGTQSLKSAFHQLASELLADLIRMTIKMLLFRAIFSLFGGVGGGASASHIGGYGDYASGVISGSIPANGAFAQGGSIFVGGRSGTDKNILALNGMPIAKVSYGERIDIANADQQRGGRMAGVSLTMHNDFSGADPAAIAAISARLDRLQAELPGTIVSTMGEAKARFIWRD